MLHEFKNCAYFNRYLSLSVHMQEPVNSACFTVQKATVYNGDSLEVLHTIASNTVDTAVTSPPYYNATSYSQWPNIYCYLYDMCNISKELYRVLKPGSIYLFNILDYFDNENNIVLSAMENKRMILGAYMLDIFKRIGFTVQGNIISNKGEIQGIEALIKEICHLIIKHLSILGNIILFYPKASQLISFAQFLPAYNL